MGLSLVLLEVVIWTNYNNILFDGVNACFPTIGALLMTVGLYELSKGIPFNNYPRVARIFYFFGKNCMGIYLFHYVFIVLIKNALNVQYISLGKAILITIVIMLVTSVIFEILKKIPILNILIKI